MPLLIALHGDSHDATEMQAAWQAITAAHGAVLFAPTCPKELHCPGGSWWRWYQSKDHDPAWLTQQVDAVKATYPIDPARIYATGYSGGSSYLGYYVPKHSEAFAAVGYVSGGYPYSDTCATCKLPVRIVIGAADGMMDPYVKPLIRFYEECGGHDVSQRIVPAVDHKGMLKALTTEAPLLWDWFAAHTNQCLAPTPAPVPVDVSVSVPPSVSPSAAVAPAPAAQAHGCACTLITPSAPGDAAFPVLLLVAALATCVRVLRPRTRQPRAHTTRPRRCP
jgi:predicted esterase